MLALTKSTGYGLIAMTHLAGLQDGELASARQIAERFGVPVALLMNVLKKLSAAGYVVSVRGAHGGYRLGQAPESINLAEVVTVVEGPIRLARCVSGEVADEQSCEWDLMASCPIADPVHRVQRRLNDFLKTVTLAEITETAGAGTKE